MIYHFFLHIGVNREDEACIICYKNVKDVEDNSEKLDNLLTKAEDVENHSRKLFASTENLLMPLVQFAFLFPTLVAFLSNSEVVNTVSEATSFGKSVSLVSDNWTSILIVSSIASSILSLVVSQTKIYFASPGKMNQKSLKNKVMIFVIIMMQVLPKILAVQAFSFGLLGSELQCPDGILVLLLAFPYFSSTCKTLMVALCLSILKTLRFKKIKQIFLSPFIFTQMEKDEDKDEIGESVKKEQCFLTETGICHLLFDVTSLLENCALSITGAFYIGKYEKNFDPLIFCGIVIGSHIVGLLLKFFYYRYHHPWMTESKAYDFMGQVSTGILSLLAVCIVVGIPYIAYISSSTRAVGRSENLGVEIGLTDLPKSGGAMAPPAPPAPQETTGLSTTSTLLYILIGFSLYTVTISDYSKAKLLLLT